MAVPKGKVSKQRRNKRRSSVWKLAAPTLVACGREISSYVPLQEGSAASLLFFLLSITFCHEKHR